MGFVLRKAECRLRLGTAAQRKELNLWFKMRHYINISHRLRLLPDLATKKARSATYPLLKDSVTRAAEMRQTAHAHILGSVRGSFLLALAFAALAFPGDLFGGEGAPAA
jgi:hypothetical protein